MLERKFVFTLVLALYGVLCMPGAGDLAAAATGGETARFLAGKGAAPGTKLAAHTHAPFYTRHAGLLARGWARYQQPNLVRLQAWWRQYRPAAYSAVLYPFGGPDIHNALALFPDADSYLLFGLEPPGGMPDPATMNSSMVEAELAGLRAAVDTFIQMNFFFTREMERRLGRDSCNSVTGLLLFFLAMNGCAVESAARIAVGPDGTLVPGRPADGLIDWQSPPRARVPGIEIVFRRPGGKTQVVRYFMLDIADAALARHSPNFITFLERFGRCVTMLKAASYLMHKVAAREPAPHFERIRFLVLAQSDFIVQDDSGIPLRYFARERWQLQFHGKYALPVTEFAHRLQKDLWNEMRNKSSGTLPFRFGYDHRPGAANLMIAKRVL